MSNLPYKHLKDLLLASNKLIEDPDPDNEVAFNQSFDDAMDLENKIGSQSPIHLQPSTTTHNFRGRHSSKQQAVTVFSTDKTHVTIEQSVVMGKTVITGQVLTEIEEHSNHWQDAQVEIFQDTALVGVGETNPLNEFEIQLDINLSVGYAIVITATDGKQLHLKNDN